MFGKHFASMYAGSMFGKPALVFAVWGYVIATMRPSRKDKECYVELNPTLLAATFASTPEDVMDAITVLLSPDPGSRSKADEGRRLSAVSEDFHTGPMQFKVVNGAKYRALRDEEERRVYLREAKRKERESTVSTNVNHDQPPSSQVEVEVEVEAKKKKAVVLPEALAASPDFVKAWEDFLAYKKQRKEKLSDMTQQRKLATFVKWGAAVAVEAIHTTIENGWQGVFEPKGTNHQPSKATTESWQGHYVP